MSYDNGATRRAASGDARPSTSLPEALAGAGIHLKRYGCGEHRTACPACVQAKRRAGDQALAVRIGPDTSACWVCHRCRWTGGLKPKQAPSYRPSRRREPCSEPPLDLEAERKAELALAIWHAAEPVDLERHWPAALYLASRGLTAWDQDRLLFHEACPFGRETAPALVAPVNCHRTGYVVGVWRIRLTTDGEKVGRFGLGPMKGRASRLFWAEGPELIVAEGIEDALAAHTLTGLPAWAALSAGNMGELVLPERLRRVLILADNDEPDSKGRMAGLEGAHKLARRLRAEGRHTVVRKPIAAKDCNEVLRAGRVA
jgi:hypothetical protein